MQDIKKLGIGCGSILGLLIVFVISMPYWPSSQKAGSPVQGTPGGEYGSVPTPPPPPPPPRKSPEETLRLLTRDQKYDEAQALALTYLSKGTEEEKQAAATLLPSIQMHLFEAAATAKNLDRALELYEKSKELARQTNAPSLQGLQQGITYMKDKVQSLRREAFLGLLAAGDKDRIMREIDLAWGDPEYRLPEKETLEYLSAQWLDATEKKDFLSAQIALRKAANLAVQDIHSITYWGSRRTPLETALAGKYPYNDLIDRGKKSLEAKEPVLAIAYLSAAVQLSSSGDPKNAPPVGTDAWLERQRLLCESYVSIAALAEKGELRWLPPDLSENKVEILLQQATRYVVDAGRMSRRAKGQATQEKGDPQVRFAVAFKAWEGLFELYRGKLRRICATQEPYRVLSYCDEVLYDIPCSYLDFLEQTHGPQKVLTMIPADILANLPKEKKTDQEKVWAYKEMVRRKEVSVDFPFRDAFTEARRKARFESAKTLLAGNKLEDAFSFFRQIFRDDPASAEAIEARTLISEKIDEAGKSRDFNTIYAFASFLIGELRTGEIPENLAKRLAPHLDAAAEFYKATAKMKRAFMLSLKADLLGDQPEGRTAAAQALEIGFQAVKELPLKTNNMEAPLLPSMIKDSSVEAIKNETGYHLMAFYDGPEKFFIRLNPYSKGSLALLNGPYELAVVVTSESITPYRTKTTYDNGFYMQKYHIVKEGNPLPGQREDFSDMFMGRFQRLRTPDGLKNATFDPASGFYLEAKQKK